jgi:DNA-binding winged helix-turn-helix (wHTH) protein
MAIAFGPFMLHRAQKLLTRDGQAVRLGSRALELLGVLGEPTSLRVHISALRKALGDNPAGLGGESFISKLPGGGARAAGVDPCTL